MALVSPSVQPVGGFEQPVSKSKKLNCLHKGPVWRATLEFGECFDIFTDHINVREGQVVCSLVKLRWALFFVVWRLWRSFRNTFMRAFIWTLAPVLTAGSTSYLWLPKQLEADQVALPHKQIRAAFFLLATTWKQKFTKWLCETTQRQTQADFFSLVRKQSWEDNDSPVMMLNSRPDTMVTSVPRTDR